MTSKLSVSIGQHSDKGCKPENQDFHAAMIPSEPALGTKGVAIALADGISSSDVSHIASQTSIKSFIEDYYSTSESWTVKTSVQRVLQATNSWLFTQTSNSRYRENRNRGYVCTFSALVIKSTTAHIFHVGDSRIFRVQGRTLEQLTEDHRLWVSKEKSYLSKALGIKQFLEFDYHRLAIELGDIFILATDGVYEYTTPHFITHCINQHQSDLDKAAQQIVAHAFEQGSDDNLTIQLIRVDTLPNPDKNEIYQSLTALPFPGVLEARMELDGFTIIRNLHSSSRSHVYLARDNESGQQLVIKVPSVDLKDDPVYLDSFLMEEWIARRINSPFVLKAIPLTRQRHYIYTVSEFVEGRTLTQWMLDNPNPGIDSVRNIVAQIAKGLRAFHRQEMLHQDLRPANILIDDTGTVKLIDFGSTAVAGVSEIANKIERNAIPGTAQYSAPEYFLGEGGSPRSDLFSLGVITYQMLTGRLPYGVNVAKCRTKKDQNGLRYTSMIDGKRDIPIWIDDALKKAVHPDPYKRYEHLSEFIHDLHRPNHAFLRRTRPPLVERNPLRFWQGVSMVLLMMVIFLLIKQFA